VKRLIFRILIIILITVFLNSLSVFAAPYPTYVRDRDGGFRYSPDLYIPSHIFNYDLNGINEIFIDEFDYLYVARSGSDANEVIIFDPDENFVRVIGHDILKSATGIHVNNIGDDTFIYVVDKRQALIFVFDKEGEVLQSFGRPTSPLFGGNTLFSPVKVAVDRQGSLYIVSEGTTGGIIQLNQNGEFIGYFGANVTRTNLVRQLQRKFLPEEFMAQFIRNVPVSMTNLSIDARGIIYVTTKGDTPEPLRKLNIAGTNLFEGTSLIYEHFEASLESVTTDNFGNVFVLDGNTGMVIIQDASGNVVCLFGARSTGVTPIGITTNPVSIAVNSKQQIYVADRGDGTILSFQATPLMLTLFTALKMHREGYHVESEPYWRDVLSRNSSLAIAYNALGLSQMRQENYDKAMSYFYLSNNRSLYSDAKWELRQEFLLSSTQYIVLGLIMIAFINSIIKITDKCYGYLQNYRTFKTRLKATKVVTEYLTVTSVFLKPADLFYDIRRYNKVTYKSVILLYGCALIVLLAGDYYIGYIFNDINTLVWWYNPLQRLTNWVLYVGLFIVANFCIASIRDGQGSFMQIVKAVSVCLVPLVFLYVPYIILSNVLTGQEQFILDTFRFVIFAWCAILVVIMISYLHNYEFRDTIACLILTIFAMVVLFVTAIVVYTLAKEAFNFFKILVEEALLRGTL